MKTSHRKMADDGFSLIETVLALGVLAVSVPLVFLALGEGGKSGMASAKDSRAGRMADACLEEIRASREGRARWFSNSGPSDSIPPDGGFWALAISSEGRVLGRITADQWAVGVARVDGQAVRYLAAVDSVPYVFDGMPAMRNVCVTVEDPAAAPQGKRGKSEFHTLMP